MTACQHLYGYAMAWETDEDVSMAQLIHDPMFLSLCDIPFVFCPLCGLCLAPEVTSHDQAGDARPDLAGTE